MLFSGGEKLTSSPIRPGAPSSPAGPDSPCRSHQINTIMNILTAVFMLQYWSTDQDVPHKTSLIPLVLPPQAPRNHPANLCVPGDNKPFRPRGKIVKNISDENMTATGQCRLSAPAQWLKESCSVGMSPLINIPHLHPWHPVDPLWTCWAGSRTLPTERDSTSQSVFRLWYNISSLLKGRLLPVHHHHAFTSIPPPL